MRSPLLLACLGLFACSGCGNGSQPASPTPTPSAGARPGGEAAPVEATSDGEESPAPTDGGPEVTADPGTAASAPPAATTGSLRGVVTFKGDLPAPMIIQATKDKEICSAGEGEVRDILVTDGKLAGAVVEITIRGKDLPNFTPPKDGFVIRQKDCLFAPRLLVAYSGAEIVVHNDDKVEHNVNTGEWNLLQSPGSEPIRQKLNYGGTPFTRVTCNIHSWMESWVYVARSPFYAASNEAGEFLIEGIPAGKKIRGTITHATLGRQRFTVNITAGETTDQDFGFEAK